MPSSLTLFDGQMACLPRTIRKWQTAAGEPHPWHAGVPARSASKLDDLCSLGVQKASTHILYCALVTSDCLRYTAVINLYLSYRLDKGSFRAIIVVLLNTTRCWALLHVAAYSHPSWVGAWVERNFRWTLKGRLYTGTDVSFVKWTSHA